MLKRIKLTLALGIVIGFSAIYLIYDYLVGKRNEFICDIDFAHMCDGEDWIAE